MSAATLKERRNRRRVLLALSGKAYTLKVYRAIRQQDMYGRWYNAHATLVAQETGFVSLEELKERVCAFIKERRLNASIDSRGLHFSPREERLEGNTELWFYMFEATAKGRTPRLLCLPVTRRAGYRKPRPGFLRSSLGFYIDLIQP